MQGNFVINFPFMRSVRILYSLAPAPSAIPSSFSCSLFYLKLLNTSLSPTCRALQFLSLLPRHLFLGFRTLQLFHRDDPGSPQSPVLQRLSSALLRRGLCSQHPRPSECSRSRSRRLSRPPSLSFPSRSPQVSPTAAAPRASGGAGGVGQGSLFRLFRRWSLSRNTSFFAPSSAFSGCQFELPARRTDWEN